MKDIQNFITEKKEYNCNYNEDDLKCLLGALAFIKVSSNDHNLCEVLGIDNKVFDELYDDLLEIVDDSNINSKVEKLYNK